MKTAIFIAFAAMAYGLSTGYLTPMRAIICLFAGVLFLRSSAREVRKANQLAQEQGVPMDLIGTQKEEPPQN